MKPKEWIFKNYPEQKKEWGITNYDDEFMCRMMGEYADYLIKGIEGYTVVDYFDVSFDEYKFFCSRVDRSKANGNSEWLIVWKKGIEISGEIHVPFDYARTSIFQIIDGFKI